MTTTIAIDMNAIFKSVHRYHPDPKLIFVQKLRGLFCLQHHARLVQRVLLRFEFHVPHQILYTILATDEK